MDPTNLLVIVSTILCHFPLAWLILIIISNVSGPEVRRPGGRCILLWCDIDMSSSCTASLPILTCQTQDNPSNPVLIQDLTTPIFLIEKIWIDEGFLVFTVHLVGWFVFPILTCSRRTNYFVSPEPARPGPPSLRLLLALQLFLLRGPNCQTVLLGGEKVKYN